jgi:hypothetical protein
MIVPLKGGTTSNVWEQPQQIIILFMKEIKKRMEFRECLLSLGAEFFVFQMLFKTEIHRSIILLVVWVCNLVAHIQ